MNKITGRMQNVLMALFDRHVETHMGRADEGTSALNVSTCKALTARGLARNTGRQCWQSRDRYAITVAGIKEVLDYALYNVTQGLSWAQYRIHAWENPGPIPDWAPPIDRAAHVADTEREVKKWIALRGTLEAMRTLTVAIGVLWRGDKVLVGCRQPWDRHGCLWEFPGGKVEPGEAVEAALRREWLEELDLAIDVGELRYEQRFENEPGLPPFATKTYAVMSDGEPRAKVHSELRWVALWELWTLQLTPSGADALRRGYWGAEPRFLG